MSLQTDDIDIRDVRLWIDAGGNGDYYINLMEIGKKLHNGNGELSPQNIALSTRICLSGGKPTTRIRLAVAELYRALEEAGFNEHPNNDKT